MEPKIPSDDKELKPEDVEYYQANEFDRFISNSQVFFDSLIAPKIEKVVREQFQLCMVPLTKEIKNIKLRIFVKTIIFVILLVMMALFIQSGTVI